MTLNKMWGLCVCARACACNCVCWEVIRPLIMSLFIPSSVNAPSLSRPHSIINIFFIYTQTLTATERESKWTLRRVERGLDSDKFFLSHARARSAGAEVILIKRYIYIPPSSSTHTPSSSTHSLVCEFSELNITPFPERRCCHCVNYRKHLPLLHTHFWINTIFIFHMKINLVPCVNVHTVAHEACSFKMLQFVALTEQNFGSQMFVVSSDCLKQAPWQWGEDNRIQIPSL